MGTLTQVEFPPAPAPVLEDATPAIAINPRLIAFTVMLATFMEVLERDPKLLSKTSAIMEMQEKLHQNEAGRVAVVASAAAGFSPRAYLELFERSEGNNGSSGSVLTDYFGVTTSNLRRLREIQKTLRQLPRPCREMVPVASSAFRTWQAAVLSDPDLARR